MKNYSFFILTLLTLASCQFRHTPAPVIFHHPESNLNSTTETVPIIDNDKPISSDIPTIEKDSEVITPNRNSHITPKVPPQKNYKIIYHELQIGETIQDVADQYKQTVVQIADLNALNPPYHLKAYQILKIKVPKDFTKAQIQQAVQPTQLELTTSVEEHPKFIWPVQGKVLVKFGQKTSYGINKGINIAQKEGIKILAATSGKVIYADYDATFGYLVIIKVVDQNIVTSYAHMEDLIVSKGQEVQQGDVIGYVGSTGKIKRPQLHFAIREGKTAKDPIKILGSIPKKIGN